MIYAVRTDAPDRRIEVGYCAEDPTQSGCEGFHWSPDSRAIAWNDPRGIWLAEVGQPGRLLLANSFRPGGRVFSLWYWSPLGRYALITSGIPWSEGGSYGVIDTRTERTADLAPISMQGGALVTWMRDGRLFITRPGDSFTRTEASAEIWRVDGEADPMLSLETKIPLGISADNYLIGSAQLASGHLAFAAVNLSTTNYMERGLYFIGLSNFVPRKVNGLPPILEGGYVLNSIVWSPDGAAAIVLNYDHSARNRTLLYVPTDGSPLIDLRPVMDEGEFQACCFVWTK